MYNTFTLNYNYIFKTNMFLNPCAIISEMKKIIRILGYINKKPQKY